MRMPRPAFLRDDRGQSFIELALAAPILVFALIGGIDLMRVAAIQQAVQNAARTGADVISQDTSVANSVVLDAIRGELNGTPGLHGLVVPACAATPVPPCARLPQRVGGLFQGTRGDGATTCLSNDATLGICYARVGVLVRFRTIVPWPLVPNTITVDRGTSMPLLN